ncbi:hypothetical protein FOLKNPGA_02604 [Legionella sp. PC1000]|nr:hypothetical protein FOLKNPGA_02604 [Legionella sp. PC1000]
MGSQMQKISWKRSFFNQALSLIVLKYMHNKNCGQVSICVFLSPYDL